MRNYYSNRNFGGGGFLSLPPIIKYLLIINVVFFVGEFLLSNFHIGPISLRTLFFNLCALQPLASNPDIGVGTGSFYPWQLITYQFMHGGLMHLFFNMFALYMFGVELENLWGSRKFLIYYILCGIGAGILQIYTADAPTVGASGAIYGVLAAFGMTFPNREILMFPLFIPIKAKYFVVLFGAIELISGFSGASSGVAHFAHVAGAATGFLLLTFGPKLGIFRIGERFDKQNSNNQSSFYKHRDDNYYGYSNYDENYNYRQNLKVHKQEEKKEEKPRFTIYVDGENINQSKINEILDKINSSGYQSLTEREKNILIEVSKKL